MRLTILTLLLATRLAAAGTAFIPNDLGTARSRAQHEGKLVLVNFYADWCKPCQQMEKTTWADPSVERFVSQNCVAVRIDFDAMEGVLYRDFFEVGKLPTTLVLDACGNELARYENIVAPARLIQWVSGFNRPENRMCGDGRSVALPASLYSTEPIFVPDASQKDYAYEAPNLYSSTEKSIISQPVLRYDKPLPSSKPTERATSPWRTDGTEPVALTGRYEVLSPPPTSYYTNPVPVSLPPQSAAAPGKTAMTARSVTTATGQATGQIAWTAPPPAAQPQGFSVQVLATHSELSAAEMKDQCLRLFNTQVAVVPPTAPGDQLYRVVVGRFGDRLAADEFKLEVRKKFADAFVKAL